MNSNMQWGESFVSSFVIATYSGMTMTMMMMRIIVVTMTVMLIAIMTVITLNYIADFC